MDSDSYKFNKFYYKIFSRGWYDIYVPCTEANTVFYTISKSKTPISQSQQFSNSISRTLLKNNIPHAIIYTQNKYLPIIWPSSGNIWCFDTIKIFTVPAAIMDATKNHPFIHIIRYYKDGLYHHKFFCKSCRKPHR